MIKKIYSVSLGAMFTLGVVTAQKSSAVIINTPVNSIFTSASFDRSSNDTLSTGADWTQTAIMRGVAAPDSGYVIGSNSYGDKQKVQIFYPSDSIGTPTPYTVVGAMYWFGEKTVAAVNPGNLKLRTYRINGANGTSSTGTTTACPGTVVVDDTVGIENVDTTNNFHIHNFSALSRFDVMVNGQYPFGVGFDVTALNVAGGDGVGLISTAEGNIDVIFPESCWEQFANNSWWAIPWSWSGNPLGTDPLDIELAIFPIAFNTASIEETPFLNGVKAFVPSPFTNTTIFNYELLTNVPSVLVNIVDMNGKILYTKSINNNVDAGKYTLDFDGSTLNAGTYVMSLQAGQGRVATKFIKQ